MAKGTALATTLATVVAAVAAEARIMAPATSRPLLLVEWASALAAVRVAPQTMLAPAPAVAPEVWLITPVAAPQKGHAQPLLRPWRMPRPRQHQRRQLSVQNPTLS